MLVHEWATIIEGKKNTVKTPSGKRHRHLLSTKIHNSRSYQCLQEVLTVSDTSLTVNIRDFGYTPQNPPISLVFTVRLVPGTWYVLPARSKASWSVLQYSQAPRRSGICITAVGGLDVYTTRKSTNCRDKVQSRYTDRRRRPLTLTT